MGYISELQYLFHFLDDNPYLRSLLTTLKESTAVDFEQWVSQNSNLRQFQFPGTEEGRARVCYGILEECASDETDRNWLHWSGLFSVETKFDLMLRDLTEAVADPFMNFLHDRIDEGGEVLYLLERFKLKVEWFRQEELYNLYKENTSVGEASLDRELRSNLFEGGVDFPFSEPSSPSGRADVVAMLGSEDPLVLEVKVFDPDRGRDKSHLRQGFHQVLRYANDYNESLGYLVVFNCSVRQLVISPGEDSSIEFPPRIAYAGKIFFVISIDVNTETASASKERPASRVTITHEDLIGNTGVAKCN